MPDLTGSAALDVLIGLSFVYLIFSLLCSAVQEAIAGILDLRARNLEEALRKMLEEATSSDVSAETPGPAAAGAAAITAEKFLEHPLIHALHRSPNWIDRHLGRWSRSRRGPSYINSGTFALALLDIVAPQSSGVDRVADAKASINAADLPWGTKQALLGLANEFAEDRDRLRAEIEGWFDSTMARASGWYRRKAQIILCVIAAGVAVGMNVNTIAIVDRLVRDDALRDAVAQQGVRTAQAREATPESVKQAAKRVEDAAELGLPMGWNKQKGDPADVTMDNLFTARTLGGWFLTFLALSLGAPFWFDTLSKFARLRNTGAPESPHENTPRGDGSQQITVKLEQKGAATGTS